MEMKKCTGKNGCGKVLPLSEFHNFAQSKDGKKNTCKVCTRKIANASHAKNPEKHRATSREWKKKNPEKVKELNKKRRQSPKGKKDQARHQKKYRERLKEKEASKSPAVLELEKKQRKKKREDKKIDNFLNNIFGGM